MKATYQLFCLHLAGSIYENLTFQSHLQRKVIARVQKVLKARPIHPHFADEAQRLCDEAERSV